MALGGGTWQTQNKILPGSYINFSSLAKASATLSNRGYAAAPFELSWGPEGTVFTVTAGDFQKNSKTIFGYAYDHAKMLPLREIFCHATTVYCYRLGAGAVKAANTFAEAKYGGARGNSIKIAVAANVDDNTKFDVSTYLDATCVDVQTVQTSAGLKANDFVTFKSNAALTVTAATALTGGTDVASIDGEAHQAFLSTIEPYAFNALCCPANDNTTVALYEAFTKRLRDDLGAKFQLVAWQSDGDHEGLIGVWNTATHSVIASIPTQSIVYWLTGAEAGVEINKSLTNYKYDGELILNTAYTQAELEAAIKAGKLLFHNVNGVVRILEDINTLLTLTDTKGEVFQSNQTMRVCDQIANDIAVLFNTRYAGTVPNDASGRASLWGDIVKYLRDLESIRAIEGFNEEIVSCEQGDKKRAVLLIINGLNIINAMGQLYMSVIIQ